MASTVTQDVSTTLADLFSWAGEHATTLNLSTDVIKQAVRDFPNGSVIVELADDVDRVAEQLTNIAAALRARGTTP